MSFTINLAKLSLDNAVMALNGVNIGSTGIKVDKVMYDLLAKDCEIKKSGSSDRCFSWHGTDHGGRKVVSLTAEPVS